MNNSNGNNDLLNRVLEGRTADEKARVLEIVRQMGIDENDEFWLISIALGQLQMLLEISPDGWAELFENFNQRLEQWTEKNTQILAAAERKTQKIEELEKQVGELRSALIKLIKVYEPNATLQHLDQKFSNMQLGMQQQYETAILEMEDNTKKLKRIMGGGIKIAFLCIAASVLTPFLLVAVTGQMNRNDSYPVYSGNNTSQIDDIEMRLNWLLTKTEKIECKMKIKPSSDKQCQSQK